MVRHSVEVKQETWDKLERMRVFLGKRSMAKVIVELAENGIK